VENLQASGLRYPLEPLPEPGDETYYDIEIHVAPDYVYHWSELIMTFDEEPVCSCGTSAVFELPKGQRQVFFAEERIRRKCEKCGEKVNLDKTKAVVRDAWTSRKSRLRGGAAYRFALLVDCGKCLPDSEGGEISASQEMVGTIEDTLQQRFVGVPDWY